MGENGQNERPSYSTDLLRVFAELLQEYEGELGEQLLHGLSFAGARVPVDAAHQALLIAIEQTGDADLGLKAARRLILGDVGAIDYVVSSASTVRSAIEQAGRYARLINDALEVKLEIEGEVALLRLENSVSLPRAAADFQVGGFFRNHVCNWLGSCFGEVTVWFTHDSPAELGEYIRTFEPAQVRFGAPALGFAFDRRILDLPLPHADPNLHAILVPYVDQRLSQLHAERSFSENVRLLIRVQLGDGGPDVGRVASQLGMSLRTLARRLETEGTTFRELLDEVRQQLALEQVGRRAATFSEITDQLGFSHVAAFHRAFRRWTGQTPRQYRNTTRGRS
jgi:AraC-like DNA-binding protein